MAAVLTATGSGTEPQWERSLCTHNGVGGCWLLREESRGRRNSIPPTQAPTARHMLAYLPRPPTDTSRYGTFPQKVGLQSTRSLQVPAVLRVVQSVPGTSGSVLGAQRMKRVV